MNPATLHAPRSTLFQSVLATAETQTPEVFESLDIDAWRAGWLELDRFEKVRPWHWGAYYNQARRFLRNHGQGLASADLQKLNVQALLGEKGAPTEKQWDNAIMSLIPTLRMSIRRVREYAWVEAAFAPSDREPALDFGHHQAIWASGAVVMRQRRKWLRQAREENWSVQELRRRMANPSTEKPTIAPRYVFALAVEQMTAFLSAVDPRDAERLEAMGRFVKPLVEQFRRLRWL